MLLFLVLLLSVFVLSSVRARTSETERLGTQLLESFVGKAPVKAATAYDAAGTLHFVWSSRGGGVRYTSSADGGASWTPDRVLSESGAFPAVRTHGRRVLVLWVQSRTVWTATSPDGGASWEIREAFGGTAGGIQVGGDGSTVAVAYWDESIVRLRPYPASTSRYRTVHAAVSADFGASWSDPVEVWRHEPGVKVHNVSVAGAQGRAFVAWTDWTPGPPARGPDDSASPRTRAYVAETDGAAVDAEEVDLTSPDEPGPVKHGGVAVTASGGRAHAAFITWSGPQDGVILSREVSGGAWAARSIPPLTRTVAGTTERWGTSAVDLAADGGDLWLGRKNDVFVPIRWWGRVPALRHVISFLLQDGPQAPFMRTYVVSRVGDEIETRGHVEGRLMIAPPALVPSPDGVRVLFSETEDRDESVFLSSAVPTAPPY